MAAPRTTTQRRNTPRLPTTGEQHAEWLGLLRPEGPFLALPVLTVVLPQGLDTVPGETRARIRQAWAEVSEAPDLLAPAWQELILGELLRYPASAVRDGVAPAGEFRGFQPDAVVSGPDPTGGSATRLHVYRRGFDEPLTDPVHGQPALAERAAQLCRDTRVPLALLTNGRFWVLVHARPGEATSTAVFDADLWLEEPTLLRAFASLCCASRVLPPPASADGAPSTSLAGLFARSADAHAHVTTTLGLQVRRAVELFVAELARLDREAGGALLGPVSERDIYRGALTALMRLVFLLFAEEQRLLPVTDPIYAGGYAVSTLYEQLDEERNLHGDEVTDRREAAWPRLLALFRAIHGGCEHPDLWIPAYGGSLFDPGAYPWLMNARITDRVVREMLDALLVLRHRGKAAERLSYARLGVEQIGHVYEGLLEFSCRKVNEPFVGLAGKTEPEVTLAELESVAAQGDTELRQWLQSCCDATVKQVEKWLAARPSLHQRADLHAACDNDAALAERVLPFWGLLRTDLRGHPTVFPAGSVLFTQVGDRRSTGTHYTPRELAEEVVEHTLAPLCFAPGPAQGAEPGVWRAKKADELLALKVVDPAMGSGAFLVSACRYLADRVVEAWERDGAPEDDAELLDAAGDRDELLLLARRKVAARCLYGVDRDDMAVELAKLSLWLVTLAKNRPFGFLDHALRCGDSLVGLVSEQQVAAFHLDADRGWFRGTDLLRYLNEHIDAVLTDVVEIREHIESTVVQDARDAADKAEQLANAEWMTRKLQLAADAVVGAALSTAVRHAPWYEESDDEEDLDHRLRAIADDVDLLMRGAADPSLEERLRVTVNGWLRGGRPQPIHPLHWPLEFPEVMRRGGFDAVVGNPPFIGGQRLTSAIGKDVREYLVEHLGKGKRGSADLCSYFLLRDLDLSWRGRVGIIATNTIAQGDTREVGLDQAVGNGVSVYRAEKSQRWPGTASLEVSLVWVGHVPDDEPRILDGRKVPAITSSLDPKSRVSGNPHRLAVNANQAFQGSNILGPGFTMSPEAAWELIDKNPQNKDVLFPYLIGEDLNSRSDCSASRWVINFHDWPIEKAQQYQDCFKMVEEKVKPFRAKNNDPRRRAIWWRFTRPTMELYDAIHNRHRVLVIAQTSRTQIPCFVPAGQVFDQKLVIFPVSGGEDLCFRSSAFQYWWTVKNSSTMKLDTVYAPSDCCENLPIREFTSRMDGVGEELHSFRRSVMLGRPLGLTKLYNQVHDPAVTDEEIRRLREIHTEIDYATAEAYGWDDLDLAHGFYDTRQGCRFTIAPDMQVEVLDLLLDLNHKCYAEEVRQGLHTKKAKPAKRTLKRPPFNGLVQSEESLF
ncbi:MAG: Eco57I restriction-modification methylase domain-containing protein [Pseudonocardiaceae bacterium]